MQCSEENNTYKTCLVLREYHEEEEQQFQEHCYTSLQDFQHKVLQLLNDILQNE